MKFYFIGGLGSNENHISEFAHCFPYPITYLDPYKVKLESSQDLVDWFEAHADSNEKTCIIAHSLGGDLARYLATNVPQITHLILLDGGYLDMDQILQLEQEIEETNRPSEATGIFISRGSSCKWTWRYWQSFASRYKGHPIQLSLESWTPSLWTGFGSTSRSFPAETQTRAPIFSSSTNRYQGLVYRS